MSDITIATADGSFTAYVARPGSGTGPGILVIQEIFGVNRVMRDTCDRLAGEGFVAVCPDLFWRIEPGIQLSDQVEADRTRAFELYAGYNEAKGVSDLIATLEQTRGLDGCAGKVATMGFCLGGKLAFLMSTRSDADCNVAYYGVGIENALTEATAITKPLLLHVAEQDQFVPPDAQRQIADALRDNAMVTLHTYPGCDHAFARTGGANYNEDAASRANARTSDFLHTYLDA